MNKSIFLLEEIPQANNLTKVGMVVIAVYENKCSFQEISESIKFTDRQGRYYRKAAEILGLIETSKRNQSHLTEAGQLFIKSYLNTRDILAAIRPSLLSIPLLREVYERVSNIPDVNENDLLKALMELSGVDKKNVTIIRRLSTFVSWLKQAKLLEQIDDSSDFRLLPIVINSEKNTKGNQDEKIFLNSILPYLHVPKTEETSDWNLLYNSYLSLKTKNEKLAWLKDKENERLARYLIGISAKEPITLEKLDEHAAFAENVEISHARLLVERSRSLRFITKSIGTAGGELEDIINTWLSSHNVAFKTSHLLEGSTKDVDFYVESLGLAIESKFSKGPGSKHSGAISDINEISKAKKFTEKLLVGVALGGEGFEDSFFTALEDSYNKKNLDFIIPFGSLEKLNPYSIERMTKFEKPQNSQLKFDSSVEMNWIDPLNDFEQGIYDSIFWLKKYSSISYMTFTARLQTWLNQTPFALECLRLILGWSETQMYNFVLNAVPAGISMLRTGQSEPEQVSLLITGMNKYIGQNEMAEIENFFTFEPSLADFISARIEAFDGIARKKHNTSKVFIEACKNSSPFEILNDQKDIKLFDSTNIKSNFSIKNSEGRIQYVHCRYYSTDGSVMSDFVKKIEMLASTENAKDWIIIVDGAGWKKRIQDLKRLLEIAKSNSLNLYTLNLWQSLKPQSKLQA